MEHTNTYTVIDADGRTYSLIEQTSFVRHQSTQGRKKVKIANLIAFTLQTSDRGEVDVEEVREYEGHSIQSRSMFKDKEGALYLAKEFMDAQGDDIN